ncbi:MAG: phosphotransferase [Rhodobacteraceae bacterium]|nr:phosphotransferase [Paracoccaceae bacterium]
MSDHSDRAREIARFVAAAGWGEAARSPLAGDASNRRYERLSRLGGQTAILMDAAPDHAEDVRAFVRIAGILAGAGLSPPRILAENLGAGLLLLEDLGDDLFARLLELHPGKEPELYRAAIDCLAELHIAAPPADLQRLDAAHLADIAILPWQWYAEKPAAAATAEMKARLTDLFATLSPGPDVLVLRDFHAENLIWLPGRARAARVGLLDFQDAKAGHRAYDVVSLLTDARRDIAPALRADMEAAYCRRADLDPARFARDTAILGVQRNLRILGVFARLSLRDGKPGYVDLVPRVWKYLARDLAHPALCDIGPRITASLPEPAGDVLSRLRGAHP